MERQQEHVTNVEGTIPLLLPPLPIEEYVDDRGVSLRWSTEPVVLLLREYIHEMGLPVSVHHSTQEIGNPSVEFTLGASVSSREAEEVAQKLQKLLAEKKSTIRSTYRSWIQDMIKNFTQPKTKPLSELHERRDPWARSYHGLNG